VIDSVSPLELAIVIAVLVAAALSRAYRPIGDEPVDQWAEARGLELTAENRPVVERYLRRARLLRTWGAVAGLAAPTLIRPLLGEPVHVAGVGSYEMTPLELGWVFVGYLVGAVCAEVSVSRPFDPARRSAALLPRELTDYLPRQLLWLQRGLALTSIGGLVVLRFVPYGPSGPPPSWGTIAVFATVMFGLAAGLERLEHWIVRRPQPFVSASLLAADDAIRAQSLHSLAGAGAGFLFFACSLVSYAFALSELEILRRTMWAPALLALLFALVACQFYGARAWQVRRHAGGSTPAALS